MGTVHLLVAATATLFLAAASAAQTLKIATIAPEGSAWMGEMRRVARAIEEQTQGRVELKFYPSGVMGSDRTVMRKIRAGQLQGGAPHQVHRRQIVQQRRQRHVRRVAWAWLWSTSGP